MKNTTTQYRGFKIVAEKTYGYRKTPGFASKGHANNRWVQRRVLLGNYLIVADGVSSPAKTIKDAKAKIESNIKWGWWKEPKE